MGMLGPVVCYQVLRGIKSKDEKDLEDIKLIASVIDKKTSTIEKIYYDPKYIGNRAVFRDSSDHIRIFRETNALYRRTFAGLPGAVGAHYFSLLVPDLNEFVDCDPFVAAALLTMNRKWGLQVFAMRIDGLQMLSAEDVKRAKKVEDLLFDNSQAAQIFLSNKISKLCAAFPEIETALARGQELESNENWIRLLELSQKGEEPIEDTVLGRRSRDPLFERKRRLTTSSTP